MLSEFLSPKPNKPKQLVKPISIQPGLLLIQALQYFKSKDYFRAQDCLTKYQSLQVSLPIDYKFILVEIYQFTNRIELALQTLRTLLPSKDPKFVIKFLELLKVPDVQVISLLEKISPSKDLILALVSYLQKIPEKVFYNEHWISLIKKWNDPELHAAFLGHVNTPFFTTTQLNHSYFNNKKWVDIVTTLLDDPYSKLLIRSELYDVERDVVLMDVKSDKKYIEQRMDLVARLEYRKGTLDSVRLALDYLVGLVSGSSANTSTTVASTNPTKCEPSIYMGDVEKRLVHAMQLLKVLESTPMKPTTMYIPDPIDLPYYTIDLYKRMKPNDLDEWIQMSYFLIRKGWLKQVLYVHFPMIAKVRKEGVVSIPDIEVFLLLCMLERQVLCQGDDWFVKAYKSKTVNPFWNDWKNYKDLYASKKVNEYLVLLFLELKRTEDATYFMNRGGSGRTLFRSLDEITRYFCITSIHDYESRVQVLSSTPEQVLKNRFAKSPRKVGMPGEFPSTPVMKVKPLKGWEVTGQTPQMRTDGIPGWFPSSGKKVGSVKVTSPVKTTPIKVTPIKADSPVKVTQDESFQIDQESLSVDPIAFESIHFQEDVVVVNDSFQWSKEFDSIPTLNRRERLLNLIGSPSLK